MNSDLIEAYLTAFKASLERLQNQPLPPQAAVELASALTQLEGLADALAEQRPLETVLQMERELSKCSGQAEIAGAVRKWGLLFTQAPDAWLALPAQETSCLQVCGGSKDGMVLPADHAAVKAFAQADLTRDYPEQTLSGGNGQPPGILLPLMNGTQTLGVLVLEGEAHYSEEVLALLRLLSWQAGSALERERLRQALQDVNQSKAKFVSVVTHELRIPMTSIKGYTDLIRTGAVGPVNEMQANFLEVIRKNVERMSVLVSDLSDISRLESGRLVLSSSWIQAGLCVQESIQNLRSKIEEKSQTLVVEVPADLPPVYADYARVVQAASNLLNNAWKYTPEKGQLAVRAYRDGNRVKVEVQDNGIGISQQDQMHIFTPFFRSEEADVREQTGWGLGLSVARGLVERMNGEIGFHSTVQAGSTFWFSLPTQQGESENGEK